MNPIGKVLEAVDDYEQRANGFWCICPAHNDHHPSLHVEEAEDGSALFICRAGCDQAHVLAALERRGLKKRDLFAGAPEEASLNGHTKGTKSASGGREHLAASYSIKDASGRLVAIHERFESLAGKRFLWKHPNGEYSKGGKIRPAELPLYGSEAVASWPEDRAIVLVEGEKPADALRRGGLHALGTVTGASGTHEKEALEVLAGRRVVLWPDSDQAGREHMRRHAKRLLDIVDTVHWFEWINPPEVRLESGMLKGQDGADHPAVKAEDPVALKQLAEELSTASTYDPEVESSGDSSPPSSEESASRKAETEGRRNQGDRLIAYALEDAEALFADQHGEPHALVDGKPLLLNSRCYSWLRRLMWEREARAVNGEYLKMAAGTLAARAEFSGDIRELHTRAAWYDGTLYYELRVGRVVKVGAGGWEFEPHPPVLFRRFPNLKTLPDPQTGGSLDLIGTRVNLKTERDRRLFTAYLVTVPLPHVDRPILTVAGAMGSGKTTIARVVKRTWDPTAPESVRLDPRDFLQKASHAHILMLDNQNTVPEWAADTLCRLVTGEADSKRRLYTDDEDIIVELKRAVLLNGINVPTDRGDVLDRSLVVELERIPDRERRTEEELWELFEDEHPKLLGALLTVLSKTIAQKSSLKLSRRPRLADWGEYAASVYEVLGWGAKRFLEDWVEVVKAQNQVTLDGSPVAQVIIKFMADKREYSAPSAELHKKLGVVAEELGVSRDRMWPKGAGWLWKRINEVLPVLVAVGIEADRSEDNSGSRIALRKVPTGTATSATDSENGEGKPETGGSEAEHAATHTATNGSSTQSTATGKDDTYGRIGNSGTNGSRSEDFSEELTAFLREPPGWYRRQAAECVHQGVPERLLKPLASAAAYQVLGTAHRWTEILPHVETALRTERAGEGP